MAEDATPKLNPVEIVEISNTAVRISEELTKIERAVEQLKTAYRNATFRGDFGAGEASMRMMGSRAYTALAAQREGLRQALYELG